MPGEDEPTDRQRPVAEPGLDRRTYLKLGASLAALTSLAGCGDREFNTETGAESGYGTGEYGAGEYGGSN